MGIDFKKLAAPFPDEVIYWRYANYKNLESPEGHKILPYLTATAVRNRLDEVLGPQGWKQNVREIVNGGIICSIAIKTTDGWVEREDVSDDYDIKVSASRAFVRAAAAWGIGRYLYEAGDFFANYVLAGVPGAAEITYNGQVFYHLPPKLNPGQPAKTEKPVSPLKPQPKAPAPRFDQAPLGNKSQIDAVKNTSAPQSSSIPSVVKASSRTYQSNSVPNAETEVVTEQEDRPFSDFVIRFGTKTKGKTLVEHTEQELAELKDFFVNRLKHPTNAQMIQARKALQGFLGEKF